MWISKRSLRQSFLPDRATKSIVSTQLVEKICDIWFLLGVSFKQARNLEKIQFWNRIWVNRLCRIVSLIKDSFVLNSSHRYTTLNLFGRGSFALVRRGFVCRCSCASRCLGRCFVRGGFCLSLFFCVIFFVCCCFCASRFLSVADFVRRGILSIAVFVRRGFGVAVLRVAVFAFRCIVRRGFRLSLFCASRFLPRCFRNRSFCLSLFLRVAVLGSLFCDSRFWRRGFCLSLF